MDSEPGQRVRERRAIRQPADESRRQVGIEEPWRQVDDLAQALQVAARDGQDPKLHALLTHMVPRAGQRGGPVQHAEGLE